MSEKPIKSFDEDMTEVFIQIKENDLYHELIAEFEAVFDHFHRIGFEYDQTTKRGKIIPNEDIGDVIDRHLKSEHLYTQDKKLLCLPSANDVAIAMFAVAVWPIVREIIREAGLPWVTSARKFSELWVAKTNKWIEKKAADSQVDVEAVQKATDKIREHLEAKTSPAEKKLWETIFNIICKSGDK